MKIIVASDEKTELTDAVIEYLKGKGNDVEFCGALAGDNAGWAAIGFEAAKKADVQDAVGIFFAGAGRVSVWPRTKQKALARHYVGTPKRRAWRENGMMPIFFA
jgi:ribose 5-phosphate isomerase RpiB